MADQWGQVETAWGIAPSQLASDFVSVWSGLLGWGQAASVATTPAGVTATQPFEPLVASPSSMLLGAFEQWYESCPLVVQV